MATQITETQHMKIFRRTDVLSTHLVIFAHGRQNGGTCAVSETQNVHSYIDIDHTFNFMPASFQFTLIFGAFKDSHSAMTGWQPPCRETRYLKRVQRVFAVFVAGISGQDLETRFR